METKIRRVFRHHRHLLYTVILNDCKRRTLFRVFTEGPCRVWRYLFLLLYMWQSTRHFLRCRFSLLFGWTLSCNFLCQDFLVFSLSRAKEVFCASSRTCSSVQNKEEHPAHYKKMLLFVFNSSKGDNGFQNILKWHCRKPFLQLLC